MQEPLFCCVLQYGYTTIREIVKLRSILSSRMMMMGIGRLNHEKQERVDAQSILQSNVRLQRILMVA